MSVAMNDHIHAVNHTPALLDLSHTMAQHVANAVEDIESIFTRRTTVEVITAAADAVVIGRAAEALLRSDDIATFPGSGIPERAGLWLAPTWAWLPASDLFENNSTSRLQPRRLDWENGPIVLVPLHDTNDLDVDRAVVTRWSEPGTAMRSGTARVVPGITPTIFGTAIQPTGRTQALLPPAGPAPTEVTVASLSHAEIRSALTALAQRGEEVAWRFLMWVERFVEKELPRANVAVGMEIREHLAAVGRRVFLSNGSGALDETSLETVKHRLMFGDGQRNGRIQSLVERAYATSTFSGVDPVTWLRRGISRDCNQAIRSAIGDPRQGRRIRAAHAMGQAAAAIGENIGVTDTTVDKALNPGGDTSSRSTAMTTVGWLEGSGMLLSAEPTPEQNLEATERINDALASLQEAIEARRAEGETHGPHGPIEGYEEAARRLRHILEAGGSAPALYLRSLGIGGDDE